MVYTSMNYRYVGDESGLPTHVVASTGSACTESIVKAPQHNSGCNDSSRREDWYAVDVVNLLCVTLPRMFPSWRGVAGVHPMLPKPKPPSRACHTLASGCACQC